MDGETAVRRFGRYIVRDQLGRGGFAEVYRAHDPQLARDVALKALFPNLAAEPEIRSRFLAEARAIAGLRHPNIVAIYDVGEETDATMAGFSRPFFTMEMIDGLTLTERLGDSSGLALTQVVQIIRALASALDHLHLRGIIHRDIKASNVMLERSGRVVLMDFGIARAMDGARITTTGALLGTPEAISPEQIQGRPVTASADIYALGVLTYQLLSGRPPFSGDTMRLLYAHANEAPPPLRTLRPDLPEYALAAVDAALAKDPNLRPSSATTFAEALAGGRPLPPPLAGFSTRPLPPPPSAGPGAFTDPTLIAPAKGAAMTPGGGLPPSYGVVGVHVDAGEAPTLVSVSPPGGVALHRGGSGSTPSGGAGASVPAAGAPAAGAGGRSPAFAAATDIAAPVWGAGGAQSPEGRSRGGAQPEWAARPMPPAAPNRSGVLWIVVGMMLLALAVMVSVFVIFARRSDARRASVPTPPPVTSAATPAPSAQGITPRATSTPTVRPVATPAIANVRAVDRRGGGRDNEVTVPTDELSVCFIHTPSSEAAAIQVLVTDRDAVPFAANDPNVVARSVEGAAESGDVCAPVRVVAALRPGERYWLWVMSGAQVAGRGGFRAISAATATPSPSPTASPTATTPAVTGVPPPPSLSLPPTTGSNAPSIKIMDVAATRAAVAGQTFEFRLTAGNTGGTEGFQGSITVSSPDARDLSVTIESCGLQGKVNALPPGSNASRFSRTRGGTDTLRGTSQWIGEYELSGTWPSGRDCTLLVRATLPDNGPSDTVTFLLRTATFARRCTQPCPQDEVQFWPYGSGPGVGVDQQGYPALRWQVKLARP